MDVPMAYALQSSSSTEYIRLMDGGVPTEFKEIDAPEASSAVKVRYDGLKDESGIPNTAPLMNRL